MEALPSDVLRRLLAAGTFRELYRACLVCRCWSLALLNALAGTLLYAEVHLVDDEELAAAELQDGSEFFSQVLREDQPLRARFAVKAEGGKVSVPEARALPKLLSSAVPFGIAFAVEVTGVFGIVEPWASSMLRLPVLPARLQPAPRLPAVLACLRQLGLASLDEEEVESLCGLLRGPAGAVLEELWIANFCRDDPLVNHLLPILDALPATCQTLDIRHVLPLAKALGHVPSSVVSLGTVVLMADIYYHSRVVGMSLSHFREHFPQLPHVRELRLIMGPGHYEEPTWPQGPAGGKAVAEALLAKLPAVTSVRVEALIESATVPPLLSLASALRARGVGLSVVAVRPASRRVPPGVVANVAAALQKAHIFAECLHNVKVLHHSHG